MPSGSEAHFYRGNLWRFIVKPIDRFLRVVLILFVQLYQYTLSFLLGNACRFYPSCSDFALDALTTKPVWQSLPMIVWRVVRCNPFCKGGHEEVPESPMDEFTKFSWPKRERRMNL